MVFSALVPTLAWRRPSTAGVSAAWSTLVMGTRIQSPDLKRRAFGTAVSGAAPAALSCGPNSPTTLRSCSRVALIQFRLEGGSVGAGIRKLSRDRRATCATQFEHPQSATCFTDTASGGRRSARAVSRTARSAWGCAARWVADHGVAGAESRRHRLPLRY